MISNLDEMKQFLQWCKETGIIAVKFDRRPSEDHTIISYPADVVFKGTPAEGPLSTSRAIPHEKFEEDGDITLDGVKYEEGEIVNDDELYRTSG